MRLNIMRLTFLMALFINMVLILPSICHALENPWQQLAKDDLEAIQNVLNENHPGIVDKENPEFREWFNNGYEQAVNNLKTVNSFYGHYFLLKQYVNGFEDGHLELTSLVEAKNIRWPGFIMAFRDNQFVVHSVSEDTSFNILPHLGARLLHCDGQPPEEMLKTNLFPYFANEAISVHWVAVTPYMLIDNGNPFVKVPQACTFEWKNQVKTLKLNWRSTKKSQIEMQLKNAAFGSPPNFEIRQFGKEKYWVSFPTFSLLGPHTDSMKQLLSQLDSIKNSELIVIDVRGNSGGSSEWGAKIIENLYGKGYLAYLEHISNSEENFIDYRVSKGNLEHFEKIIPSLLQQYGEDSLFTQHFRDVATGIKKALSEGNDLYRTKVPERESFQKQPVKPKNPVSAKVFLLTDGVCFSSCLDFLDLFLSIDEITHIGLPTSADTLYMEVRNETLPSGIMRLSFATKVYRNRKRGKNEFYIPQYSWKGDIWNTKAIEQWILELAQKKQRIKSHE